MASLPLPPLILNALLNLRHQLLYQIQHIILTLLPQFPLCYYHFLEVPYLRQSLLKDVSVSILPLGRLSLYGLQKSR